MQSASIASSTLRSLFACKAWANEELFGVLGRIDAAAYPADVHGAIRILNHVYVVDCIFKGHLAGVPHGYTATNTKETPELATLAAGVQEVDRWYVDYVAGLKPAQLQERVRFRFTDGDAGAMTREEILMHMITHGAYHRGQAGQVIRGASAQPPRDLYTRFLHASEPERRA